ncbi:hypothetical protein UFOVP84_30 [uncultured Caudovirales phage]|uniref:BppU N-terminal domain-containing protein n=1 Tax=uncultured Caudovirales phage TaxID=2100421 RepID=A0A6J5L010_9CAUD|nr:hypothetical protein UFOVP84_30 [uncultured Caudovirales phage]
MSYNLEITQGTDYTRTFTVLDATNTVINLTSCVLTAQIRRNHSSAEYVSFTMSIINATTGKVSMYLPSTISDTLDGKYMYDIFLTNAASKKFKIEDGLITIVPKITRLV